MIISLIMDCFQKLNVNPYIKNINSVIDIPLFVFLSKTKLLVSGLQPKS